MFLPTFLLMGNFLGFAPATQSDLNLPTGEGEATWYPNQSDRTDRYGDPLPPGAVARFGARRFLIPNRVNGLAFSPDGRTVAAASHGGVWLCDAASGKTLAHFRTPNSSSFQNAAFLPLGKYLVTQTHEGRILIWALTPAQRRPFQGPVTDKSSNFALSGDGKRLAFLKERIVRLWDLKSGKEIAQLGPRQKASRLALSADGKWLASLSDGVTIWDVPSGKSLCQIPSAQDETTPKIPREHFTNIALSSNGKILAGMLRPSGGQTFLRLWEPATGKELRKIQAIDRTPHSLILSPDGRFLALASHDGLQVWETRTGKSLWHLSLSGRQLSSACFSPDGRTLATGMIGAVKLWETTTGRERCPVPEWRDGLNFIALSADGRTVLTAGDTRERKPDFGATVREDPGLRYWDAASGNRLLEFPSRNYLFPHFAALSADQRTIATWGQENNIEIRDIDSEKVRCRIPCEKNLDVWVLSDDGKLLALGYRYRKVGRKQTPSRLLLWDARTAQSLGELKGQRGYFGEVRFSPDGKMLASIDRLDHAVHVWDVSTRKELFCFKPKPCRYLHLAFRRDSRFLAVSGAEPVSGAQPEIRFVEIPSGKELPKIPSSGLSKKHPSAVLAMLFAPDGKRLILGDRTGRVFVWEWESKRLLKQWQANPIGVTQLALSEDGKVLLTRGAHTALIWEFDHLLESK